MNNMVKPQQGTGIMTVSQPQFHGTRSQGMMRTLGQNVSRPVFQRVGSSQSDEGNSQMVSTNGSLGNSLMKSQPPVDMSVIPVLVEEVNEDVDMILFGAVNTKEGIEGLKMEFYRTKVMHIIDTRDELLKAGYSIFTQDIGRGRRIEKPKIYIEGDIAAANVVAQKGSVLVEGSIIGAEIRANEHIIVRDGVVKSAQLIALGGTVYVTGNVESGTRIVAEKIVIDGAAIGAQLLANDVAVGRISNSQIYSKTIRIAEADDKYGDNIIVCHTLDYAVLLENVRATQENERKFAESLQAAEMKIIEYSSTLGDVIGARAYKERMVPKIRLRLTLTPEEVVKIRKALAILQKAKDIDDLRSLKEELSKRSRQEAALREELMRDVENDQMLAKMYVGSIQGVCDAYVLPTSQFSAIAIENITNLRKFVLETEQRMIVHQQESGEIDWKFSKDGAVLNDVGDSKSVFLLPSSD